MIPVKPTQIYPTLTYIDYKCIELKLHDHISFSINFYNDIDILIDVRTVVISADEYFAWGEDDDYIPAIIFYKLGLNFNMPTPSGILVNLNNKYFNENFGDEITFSESETLDLTVQTESILKISPMFNVIIKSVNTWQILDLGMTILDSVSPTSTPQIVYLRSTDVNRTAYYKVKITNYLLLYKVSFEVLEVL